MSYNKQLNFTESDLALTLAMFQSLVALLVVLVILLARSYPFGFRSCDCFSVSSKAIQC